MMAADQKELESFLTCAIYSTGIPFNILENEDMKAFFAKACLLFKLLTRQSLSTTLLDQEFKDIMITTLKPIFYKSIPTKEERHSAENIAQGIKLTIEQAGIDKFAAVITDNAPNIKAAWRILKTEYPNKVFLDCW